MEDLYLQHNQTIKDFYSAFSRDFQEEIYWNERLLFIKGSRGVGKTTLILQHIAQNFKFDNKALYVSMDNLSMANKRIFDVAQYHITQGGTHLFIDEIHKYSNWSQELKNIYDTFRNLHVVVSGSSILQLYKGNYDLSRRGVTYILNGLSLREFIQIETNTVLPKFSLDEIMQNHVQIATDITKKINPITYFKNYLSYGYYPFYLEGVGSFHQKLNNAINQTIENDIPQIYNMDVVNIGKIKKLLYHIATNAPFQPNITKLAESLDLSRYTLIDYLKHMQEGNILNLLTNGQKSYQKMAKPEKIYLHNTNIAHLVPEGKTNLGNLRESFFMNQLNGNHTIEASIYGDFMVDDRYIFEIGGGNKSFKQIKEIQNSYLALDHQLVGFGNKIPLWLFGFLKNQQKINIY